MITDPDVLVVELATHDSFERYALGLLEAADAAQKEKEQCKHHHVYQSISIH